MQGGRSRLASSAVRPCPPDRFCRWSLFIALSSLEPEAFYFASDLYDPVTRIERGPVILPTANFGLAPILMLSRSNRTNSRAGYVQHTGRPRFLNSSSKAVATSPVNSLTLGDHRSSSSDQFRQSSHSKYQPVERVCEVGHSVRREILLSGSGAGPASPPSAGIVPRKVGSPAVPHPAEHHPVCGRTNLLLGLARLQARSGTRRDPAGSTRDRRRNDGCSGAHATRADPRRHHRTRGDRGDAAAVDLDAADNGRPSG